MSSDPLGKVTPGQPFEPKAAAWNAFVDAAKAHRGGNLGFTVPPRQPSAKFFPARVTASSPIDTDEWFWTYTLKRSKPDPSNPRVWTNGGADITAYNLYEVPDLKTILTDVEPLPIPIGRPVLLHKINGLWWFHEVNDVICEAEPE